MRGTLSFPHMTMAVLSGMLFGSGLYISQMLDPLKVLRFPDFGAIPSGGRGMSGICPGPAITLITYMPENLIIFITTLFIGSFAGSYVQD